VESEGREVSLVVCNVGTYLPTVDGAESKKSKKYPKPGVPLLWVLGKGVVGRSPCGYFGCVIETEQISDRFVFLVCT